MRKFYAIIVAFSLLIPAYGKVAERTQHFVFVPGFGGGEKRFHPLAKKLRAQGHKVLIASLDSPTGKDGLIPLAESLKNQIHTEWGNHPAPMHIIAYSMGGLITRHYLQNLDGRKYCASFTTLATPHHGTFSAKCWRSLGAADMRPGSNFLTNLEKTAHTLEHLPIYSFRTPWDLIILPSRSSDWNLAQNYISQAPAHPFIVHSPTVRKHILSLTNI